MRYIASKARVEIITKSKNDVSIASSLLLKRLSSLHTLSPSSYRKILKRAKVLEALWNKGFYDEKNSFTHKDTALISKNNANFKTLIYNLGRLRAMSEKNESLRLSVSLLKSEMDKNIFIIQKYLSK